MVGLLVYCFIVHKFIVDKCKSRSGKSFENVLVSPCDAIIIQLFHDHDDGGP